MASNCSKCIFCSRYSDMGASFDVCILHDDLARAQAEIKFYSLAKCCKFYLSKDDLIEFALNNDKDDVSDVFNYISLNKE